MSPDERYGCCKICNTMQRLYGIGYVTSHRAPGAPEPDRPDQIRIFPGPRIPSDAYLYDIPRAVKTSCNGSHALPHPTRKDLCIVLRSMMQYPMRLSKACEVLKGELNLSGSDYYLMLAWAQLPDARTHFETNVEVIVHIPPSDADVHALSSDPHNEILSDFVMRGAYRRIVFENLAYLILSPNKPGYTARLWRLKSERIMSI